MILIDGKKAAAELREELKEEVLILKETPEPSSAGYNVGRVNDSSPLNISYARDYVAINDPETRNSFRLGIIGKTCSFIATREFKKFFY